MGATMDELKRSIRSVVREEMVQNQPKESHVEHATHCPNCYKGIIEKLNETSDFICGDCGLPLGSREFVEKLEKCPNCGNANPKEVDR